MSGRKRFTTPPTGRSPPKKIIEYERARADFVTSSRRYREIASSIPHSDKIRNLFQKWAPIYDTYMRITNHEGAAREVVRQLNSIGYFKKDRIFLGKGMDLGGGTGLITREIGYRAIRKALVRLKDNPEDQHLINFVNRCLRKQSRIINLIEDPVDSEKRDPHLSMHILSQLRQMVDEDMQNEYVAGLKHCHLFHEIINRSNITISDVINENNLVIRTSANNGNDPVVFDLRPLMLGYMNDMLSLVAKQTANEFHKTYGTNAVDFLKKRLSDIVDITVIDISPSMLEIAREKVRPVYLGLASDMFLEGDATKLSQMSAQNGWKQAFDFVIISQLLHLLPDEGRTSMLMGVNEVLKPGGKLIVVDEWSPLYSGKSELSDDPEVLFTLEQIKETFHDIFHPKDRGDMRSIIEESGFYYSGIRSSHPIDGDHRMFAHLYKKKSGSSIIPRA